MKISTRTIFLLLLCLPLSSIAIFPHNHFTIYDPNTAPHFLTKKFSLDLTVEGAVSNHAHNKDGNRVNVLQMWSPSQNGIAAISGFDENSELGQLAALLTSANDDGIRGHVVPTAELSSYKAQLAGYWRLPHNFFVSATLPFYNMKLTDPTWEDQTKNKTFSDTLVKEFLTDQFTANIKKFSGPNIQDGWERFGIGDATIRLHWSNIFIQQKPILKRVLVGLRGGLSLPTGKHVNEDKLFAFPFGNDGSLGIVFGGSIQLSWWKVLRGGIDVDFMSLFGTTRDRRIQISNSQTTLILLEKQQTRKEWGVTQQYNLYLETPNLLEGLTFRTAYQHIRHNRDKLAIATPLFADEIANKAANLQEWTQHSVYFSARYENNALYAQLYYKHPFNGKRTIQGRLFGGTLGFTF